MNDFSEVTKSIKEFCKEREWSKFHDPKNLALSLNLESMEVLELFQWTKDNEINPDKLEELPDELADVIYWLIMLSNHYNVDLIESLEKKMKKNREKYPIEKSKGVSTKYNQL